MTPAPPKVCRDCVHFVSPPVANGVHGESWTCRLFKMRRRSHQLACGHSKRSKADEKQGRLL